ncbi:hypothetical protein SVAN01_04416 [Stagonosporopsis vannaccii]|nr:hypothetical protein SVAN01_04416 [Stagonosporopsis vannaccii]
MTDKTASITDLPLDILVLIFPYLDANSFLSLCSTCKAFQQPSIRLDPAYWSFATRSTFRVPNQPVVQHDGLRWQKLYRRMLTQSHVYTWGSNDQSRLGHSYANLAPQGPMLWPRRLRRGGRASCAFPIEMEDTQQLGIIADMQSGGWSTTLLTADGALHTAGVLNGLVTRVSYDRMAPLTFPTAFMYSANDPKAYEPSVAIRQFSAGRSHVLGLSDNGKIWSWYNAKKAALQVKFAHVDLREQPAEGASANKAPAFGHVRQVEAGWSRSSAYVQGVGIVVWDTIDGDSPDSQDREMDTMLVLENAEVPKTNYRRPKGQERETEDQRALGEEVGVVTNYIILEHFVVFATDIGKVFCGLFGDKNRVDDVLELRDLRSENGTAVDVQGSFRRFAVFKHGEVITAEQDYLHQCWNARGTNSSFRGLHRIPALQHNDVISVAFGDYHYHALHSDGKITSYGTEHACGALGLGESGPQGKARGIAYDPFTQEGRLLPHAYTYGRQVWFDSRKRDWIQHIIQNVPNDDEGARARADLFESQVNVQGEVSEWIEQEGREWDKDTGEDGLGAYFALRVSAAGWHSGALVLVNDELVKKNPSYSYEGKTFPRLRLSDGTEMPGSGDLDVWRHGQPKWQLDAVP